MATIQELTNQAEAHANIGRRLGKHVTAIMIVVIVLLGVVLVAAAAHNNSVATAANNLQFVLIAIQMIMAGAGGFHYRKANELLEVMIQTARHKEPES